MDFLEKKMNAEVRLAISIYADEFQASRMPPIEFWEQLPRSRKLRCALIVNSVIERLHDRAYDAPCMGEETN